MLTADNDVVKIVSLCSKLLKIKNMKKVLLGSLVMLALSIGTSAQTVTKHKSETASVSPSATKTKTVTATTETKAKPTSTVSQKLHNTVKPHHKKYSGTKTKTTTTK